MRILLITPYYAPDLGPSAPLFTMLCEELVKLGYEVSVIAAVPHYPTGKVSPEFRGKLIQYEKRKGVNVTRVWVPSVNRANLKQRFLTFICYQVLATLVGLKHHYEVVIVTDPIIETGLPFLVLGTIRQKPIILSVEDLYPEVGIKLGIFKSYWIIKLIQYLEQFYYSQAKYIRVLSQGFKQILKKKGVPESKLALIWNWVDTDFIKPLPRINEFSKQRKLQDLFVVMYAGNIGFSQGLEQVIEAAKLLSRKSSICFVFIGDGGAKPELQKMVKANNLSNVRFIDFQPYELLPMVLASADVFLITLKRDVIAESVPSKCFSIMASGRPIIAAVNPHNDIVSIIHKANCGLHVEPENPYQLANAIVKFYQNRHLCINYGRNGREYVEKIFSKLAAAKKFHELFQQL